MFVLYLLPKWCVGVSCLQAVKTEGSLHSASVGSQGRNWGWDSTRGPEFEIRERSTAP